MMKVCGQNKQFRFGPPKYNGKALENFKQEGDILCIFLKKQFQLLCGDLMRGKVKAGKTFRRLLCYSKSEIMVM